MKVQSRQFYLSADSKENMFDRIQRVSELLMNTEFDPEWLCNNKSGSNFRGAMVYRNKGELLDRLADFNLSCVKGENDDKKTVFMFTGQGLLFSGICRGIYQSSLCFSSILDYYSHICFEETDIDVRKILFDPGHAESLIAIDISPIVLLTLQFVLAKYLMLKGVFPFTIIGHSLGEYLSAIFSGVLSFKEALKIVKIRGEWMKSLPEGRMLSVPLDRNECEKYLSDDISLAADHGESCILSGSVSAIENLSKLLKSRLIFTNLLNIERAGHSHILRENIKKFEEKLMSMQTRKPVFGYYSTTSQAMTDCSYSIDGTFWAEHSFSTVEFNGALKSLISTTDCLLLEIGPGNVLTGIASNQSEFNSTAMNLIPAVELDEEFEIEYFLQQLSRLWCDGLEIDMGDKNFNNKISKRYLSRNPEYREIAINPISVITFSGHTRLDHVTIIKNLENKNIKCEDIQNSKEIDLDKFSKTLLIWPTEALSYDTIILWINREFGECVSNFLKCKIIIPLTSKNILKSLHKARDNQIISEIKQYAESSKFNLVFGLFLDSDNDDILNVRDILLHSEEFRNEKVFIYSKNQCVAV